MSETSTKDDPQAKRPTIVQVRAAQALVDRFNRGLADEPGAEVRRIAETEPRPTTEPDGDLRPTQAQVRAAQGLISMYEKGHGPEPDEAVRRIAAAEARPYV